MTASRTVLVDPPRVRGGTVRFSWHHPGGTRLQRRTRWTVSYPGVDLAGLPRAVLWDVFLCLQLRVWRGEPRPLTVVLPEGVAPAQVDWWRAFHDAEHVRVVATGPAGGDESPLPPPVPGRVAVSFGGGKDSSLALTVLRRSRRRRDVVPVHVLQHTRHARRARWAVTTRGVLLVVLPTMLRHRVPVRVVSNDFLSTLTTAGRRHAPHINLYGPALLPLLLDERVGTVTFSRTAAGYRATPRADGSLRWSNPTGRPESLRAMGEYLSARHGYPLSLQGTHQAIPELVSYAALAALDRPAAARVVMCMRTTRLRRCCHGCTKCLEQGLFGLAYGVRTRGLDLERVFTSALARQIVEAASAAGPGRTRWGVAPFDPVLGTRTHFASFCHALHVAVGRMDDAQLDATPGLRNLRAMHEAWGRPFPGAASIDPAALVVGDPVSREVAAQAVRIAGLAADGDLGGGPRMLVGDEAGHYRHDLEMPTPRLDAWRERWIGELSARR